MHLTFTNQLILNFIQILLNLFLWKCIIYSIVLLILNRMYTYVCEIVFMNLTLINCNK